jgi:hypothetical protein
VELFIIPCLLCTKNYMELRKYVGVPSDNMTYKTVLDSNK